MADRKPLVGGNWKMNTDLAAARALAEAVAGGCSGLSSRCDVVVYPPFPYLQAVGGSLGRGGPILGAQDVFDRPDGAFTGEVSAAMLLDLGARSVLVGHSERRHVIGESDELIRSKVRFALEAGLGVVLCVGETLEQREQGRTDEVNVGQVRAALEGLGRELAGGLSIAYEPVWAIGTGRVATPGDAAAAHRVIRGTVAEIYDGDIAASIRIQYGGSVKAKNAPDLFAEPDIDGALVGGASLDAGEFVTIVRAAAEARAHSAEAHRS